MKHFASPEFWFHYRQLPESIRDLADKNFALLKADRRHPSLRFKKVGIFWSARVGLRYRALAKERAEGLVWFWIRYPVAYFPENDVSPDTLQRTEYTTQHHDLGLTSWYAVRAGERSAPRGAWQHIDLPAYASFRESRFQPVR